MAAKPRNPLSGTRVGVTSARRFRRSTGVRTGMFRRLPRRLLARMAARRYPRLGKEIQNRIGVDR